MSEIKGQILGIILTLSIFLAVGVVITNSFQSISDNMENKVSEVVSYTATSVSL